MEKRVTRRFPRRIAIKFGIDEARHTGFTGDISGTGIFVKSGTVFPPGTYLEMNLNVPNQPVIHLRGRVVWAKRVPPNMIRFIKKSGMGVFLDEVPLEYYSFLENLEI